MTEPLEMTGQSLQSLLDQRPGKARAITIYDPATGATLRRVSAVPGEEEKRVPEGLAWREGEHEGRFCLETGAALTVSPFPVTIGPNTLSGIPEGTKVIVADVKQTPVDGVLHISVDYPETVLVRLANPLYEAESGMILVACTPEGNPEQGGAAVEQDAMRMRIGGYAKAGAQTDQLDEIWKLLRGIAAVLTPKQRATLDAGALAMMDEIAAVKSSIPIVKKGNDA